jgi:hypothetical protein
VKAFAEERSHSTEFTLYKAEGKDTLLMFCLNKKLLCCSFEMTGWAVREISNKEHLCANPLFDCHLDEAEIIDCVDKHMPGLISYHEANLQK